MNIDQAKDLLDRYLKGDITSTEKTLVENWYSQLIETGELDWSNLEKSQIKKALESKILKAIQEKPKPEFSKVKIMSHKLWWAAASIVVLLGLGTYFLFFYQKQKKVIIAESSHEVLSPQSIKAVVTLANGQKISLDSISYGDGVTEGNLKIMKLKTGEIAYQSSGSSIGELQYNTLENPRGSKVVNLILSDGSKVWLNAGSSLKYPVAFIGKERKVFITGEAYFEVVHNPLMPFTVSKDAMQVRVLGTHFNVNTYGDDNDNIKVTLLQGSVKVSIGSDTKLLKPGQQALVQRDVQVVNNVDMEQVMAWKNGFFQFDKASLQSVLKQISRWYDVEVVYEGKNRGREFVGEMERSLSLTEVLKILEINKVHFVLAEKKLIIKPD